MRCRIFVPVVMVFAFFLAAFSTGSGVFLGAGLLLSLMLGCGALSVWWASRTMRITTDVSGQRIVRGQSIALTVSVMHDGWLPIAPIAIELDATPETDEPTITLSDMPGRKQVLHLPFHADHVGVSRPGIRRVTVTDLFGFFSISWQPTAQVSELLVLPMVFEVDDLHFAPGDQGLGTMARATEDLSSPSDVRGYQPGDAMKKIHWKLSLRKNELMVRKYEEPIMQRAMVLMDCARPPFHRQEDVHADVRDTLLETAASVMASQEKTEHSIQLPLFGAHPVELDKSMGMPMILEHLARADFSETDRFDSVLQLETRRIRQVGAVVVITARLTGEVVEVMCRMRRMGPTVRLYYISLDPENETVLPFIARLQQATIEVCYVRPMKA